MRQGEFNQKLDMMENELDLLSDRMKEVSKEIKKMHNMMECPRCYHIFSIKEMDGELCKYCEDFLEKEKFQFKTKGNQK